MPQLNRPVEFGLVFLENKGGKHNHHCAYSVLWEVKYDDIGIVGYTFVGSGQKKTRNVPRL